MAAGEKNKESKSADSDEEHQKNKFSLIQCIYQDPKSNEFFFDEKIGKRHREDAALKGVIEQFVLEPMIGKNLNKNTLNFTAVADNFNIWKDYFEKNAPKFAKSFTEIINSNKSIEAKCQQLIVIFYDRYFRNEKLLSYLKTQYRLEEKEKRNS